MENYVVTLHPFQGDPVVLKQVHSCITEATEYNEERHTTCWDLPATANYSHEVVMGNTIERFEIKEL